MSVFKRRVLQCHVEKPDQTHLKRCVPPLWQINQRNPQPKKKRESKSQLAEETVVYRQKPTRRGPVLGVMVLLGPLGPPVPPVKETTLRPETQQLEAAYLLFHLPIGARREALVLRRGEARRRSFRPSPSSLPARRPHRGARRNKDRHKRQVSFFSFTNLTGEKSDT